MSAFRPDGWTTPELAQAVERGQLELHYQPVVDLRSGGIVGAEALLRWRHPTLGLLPPGQFLPVVESSGLMPEIGAWVLGEACRQMRDWRMLAWRPFRLAVNVSASQVGPDFDGWVKGVLADAELPAEYLEIELTESVAFGDPAIFPALDGVVTENGKNRTLSSGISSATSAGAVARTIHQPLENAARLDGACSNAFLTQDNQVLL